MNNPELIKEFCDHAELMKIAQKCAIQALCESDQLLFDEDLTAGEEFAPDYGEVLYDACPGVRYVVAEDFEDARRQFLSLMDTVIELTSTDASGSPILIDMQEKGVIEFTTASENGAVAQIKVKMPHVPGLSQVIYMVQNAWPRNAGNANIKLGDVFEAPSGNRWICVKTCESGPGYLATFDIYDDPLIPTCGYYLTKVVDPFLGDHPVHQEEEKYISYLHYGHAREAYLRALNQFMYNDDGSRNVLAEFFLSRYVSANMFQAMYTENCCFICGDDSWHYRTTNEHKYTYWRYSVRKTAWVEETQKSTYIFMGAKYYIMKNNYKHSVVESDHWNSYEVPIRSHESGTMREKYILVRFYEYNSTFQKDNFKLKKIE